MNSYQKQKTRIAKLENYIKELEMKLRIICLYPDSNEAALFRRETKVWAEIHKAVDSLTTTGETI